MEEIPPPYHYESIDKCAKILESHMLRMVHKVNKTIDDNKDTVNDIPPIKNISNYLVRLNINNMGAKHKAHWIIKKYINDTIKDPQDADDLFNHYKIKEIRDNINEKTMKEDIKKVKAIIDNKAASIKYAERKIRTVPSMPLLSNECKRPQTELRRVRMTRRNINTAITNTDADLYSIKSKNNLDEKPPIQRNSLKKKIRQYTMIKQSRSRVSYRPITNRSNRNYPIMGFDIKGKKSSCNIIRAVNPPKVMMINMRIVENKNSRNIRHKSLRSFNSRNNPIGTRNTSFDFLKNKQYDMSK